jgi:hypothetical protein
MGVDSCSAYRIDKINQTRLFDSVDIVSSMDRPIPQDLEEIMTQLNPQPAQALAAQPVAASGGFVASMLSMRTVALSLLVDRALSA